MKKIIILLAIAVAFVSCKNEAPVETVESIDTVKAVAVAQTTACAVDTAACDTIK